LQAEHATQARRKTNSLRSGHPAPIRHRRGDDLLRANGVLSRRRTDGINSHLEDSSEPVRVLIWLLAWIHLTHSRWSALMLWQKRLAAGGHAWCVDSPPRVTREYDRRAFPLVNAVGPLPHSHSRCCNLKTTANNSCMGLCSVCNAKLAAAREANSRTRLSRRACKSLHTTVH
jgi:hypothetical protein